MKRFSLSQHIGAFALVVILASAAFGQQPAPPTPEQQKQQDVLNLLQRETAQATDRARQAELQLAELTRRVESAEKAAAACKATEAPKK